MVAVLAMAGVALAVDIEWADFSGLPGGTTVRLM